MDTETPISSYARLTPLQKKALSKLGIHTVYDLIYHFPVRYGDTKEIKNISGLIVGEEAVVYGKISNLKTTKAYIKKIPLSEGVISDDTGHIKIVWFNQPYIAKMIKNDSLVRIEGTVAERKGEMYFSNPKIEITRHIPIGVGSSLFGSADNEHTLYPVYPESRGITSNWIYHTVTKLFSQGILDNIPDILPSYILDKYNLPNTKTSLIWIHTPKKESDALSARKRFAFEEIFCIHIRKEKEKLAWKHLHSLPIDTDKKKILQFTKGFPFTPTDGQINAIETIRTDFTRGYPMSRLLEGDVGSGKTAVASATAYAVVTSQPKGQNFGNLQVAYMAPTEILAKQQFENFIAFFRGTGIQIGLITGSICKKFPSKIKMSESTKISKTQLLKWIANGEIPIVVGTHALIQKSVVFKHLAYVIIDEQHRFGTLQRQKLTTKDTYTPHLLSMTATPIPRTLSLTIYGDLDISILDQMPLGRKPIITTLVTPDKRKEIYEAIKKELNIGRQLYVICPRIEEPDPNKESAVIAKSVTEEAKRLKAEVFQSWNIGVLHSKMTNLEKEKVMSDFEQYKTDILVATSVVEVGVNVPNATMIIIEGAERFGLSQLHQLRGRVIRSNHQAYCYVFSESSSKKTIERLSSLIKAKNGFELAEYDLAQRGAGQLYGLKQWGIGDIGMEAIQNIKLVEASRLEARTLIEKNPTLTDFPLLKKAVGQEKNRIHFE